MGWCVSWWALVSTITHIRNEHIIYSPPASPSYVRCPRVTSSGGGGARFELDRRAKLTEQLQSTASGNYVDWDYKRAGASEFELRVAVGRRLRLWSLAGTANCGCLRGSLHAARLWGHPRLGPRCRRLYTHLYIARMPRARIEGACANGPPSRCTHARCACQIGTSILAISMI